MHRSGVALQTRLCPHLIKPFTWNLVSLRSGYIKPSVLGEFVLWLTLRLILVLRGVDLVLWLISRASVLTAEHVRGIPNAWRSRHEVWMHPLYHVLISCLMLLVERELPICLSMRHRGSSVIIPFVFMLGLRPRSRYLRLSR